jgi:hypothetical protein
LTKQALIQPLGGGHYDMQRWVRDGLRNYVAVENLSVGNEKVSIFTEPLIKELPNVGLAQSVRVRFSGAESISALVGKIEIYDSSGKNLVVGQESGPNNSVRLFVSEVANEVAAEIKFEKQPSLNSKIKLVPQRHWTVHLIHHTHLDIGYTDPQGVVLAEHLNFLDAALDLAVRTKDYPDAAKFRWCVEALWSFDEWVNVRPPEKIAEFVALVKAGIIELTAMPYNLHSETCSTDELHELLRLKSKVSKQYGIDIKSAMQTDVPGATAGMPEALSQNGVKYLSVAHNWAGRSVPHLVGGQEMPRIFRWQSSSGASVLVWVADTPHGLAYMEGPMLGFHEEYELVDELLPAYLQSLAENPWPYPDHVFGWALKDAAPITKKPYPWDILHLRIQGQFADNAPPRFHMASFVKQWNETWAYPKLRLSTNTDFFEDAEARYGNEIKTYQGDWTDWWVEGVGSGARPLAMVRSAQSKVADAQSIAAVAGFFGSDDAVATREESENVYSEISLFNEHTWGAANPWTYGDTGMDSGDEQWHWKYSKALEAEDQAEVLKDRALAHLSNIASKPKDAVCSYLIFNSCNWERNDEVEAFLPESLIPLNSPVKVVDSRTGEELSFYERPQVNPKHRDAGRFLHIFAKNIPSLGMARFDVFNTENSKKASTALKTGIIENEFFKIELDTSKAAIGSIFSKLINKELISSDSLVGMNAYVYDEYASAGGFNHQSGQLEGSAKLEFIATRNLGRPAAILEHEANSVKQWITYESHVIKDIWIRTTVSLTYGVNRVDVTNRIHKPFTMTKESGFFAFPFSFDDPKVRLELTGSVTGTDIPVIPGSAHYMQAIRRWIAFEEADNFIAWVSQDSPLVQMGNIAMPYVPFPPSMGESEPATVYSWIFNNIWDTNFPPQQGFEMNFSYSISAASKKDVVSAAALGARTSAKASRPLAAAIISETGDSSLKEFSLGQINNPKIRVVGITANKSNEILVRLQSLSDDSEKVVFTLDSKFKNPRTATLIGEAIDTLKLENSSITLEIPKFGVKGILLEH